MEVFTIEYIYKFQYNHIEYGMEWDGYVARQLNLKSIKGHIFIKYIYYIYSIYMSAIK